MTGSYEDQGTGHDPGAAGHELQGRASTPRQELRAVESTLPEHSQFTLVFQGNLRQFAGNPFLTDTPFGRPVIASIGDATASIDALALLDDPRLRQALGYMEDGAADEIWQPLQEWIADRDHILSRGETS